MTPQEAIRRIKNHNEIHSRKERHFAIHITEALNIACEALEKQIPKKPEESYDGYADGNPVIDYHCPNCYKEVDEDELEHHCECGQVLDWSDTE